MQAQLDWALELLIAVIAGSNHAAVIPTSWFHRPLSCTSPPIRLYITSVLRAYQLEWAGLWSVLEQAHSQMPFHSPWSQAVNLSTW